MEINGKYKRKGTVGTNIFIPINTETLNEEEYVLFENGAKCKLSTFKQDFELVNNIENNKMNENINIDIDDSPIDPDKFFSGGVDDSILDQVEQAVKNPAGLNNTPSRQDSRDLSNPQPPEHMTRQNNQAINYDLNSRLGNNQEQNQSINQEREVKTNRLPEHDIFDRVKSNSDLEIIIPFKITIPKSQKIDTMDDMFESSFIEYLAQKYVDENIVSNLDNLKQLIQSGIEEWVEKDLNSNRKKKASVKTDSFEIKKEEPKKEEPTEEKEEKVIKTDDMDDLTSKLRNQPQEQDVNISKIYIINTEAQYNAVKNRYNQYKENNPKHPDIDRLEDMINIYDEQIAEIKKNNTTNDAVNDKQNKDEEE